MNLLSVALTVTSFTMLATGICGFDTPSPLNPKLEMDCSGPPVENQMEVIPDVSYPFRNDYFTLHECMAYEEVPCSPTKSDYCFVDRYGRPDLVLSSRFYKTYFELNCAGGYGEIIPGGWRSFMQAYTNKFSIFSPKRALIIKIRERSDARDPVHSDVFEPVRGQVIDITVQAVASTEITTKIYHIGTLPSLVALHIENGRNLSVKRHDFNRIPNVRLLVFFMTTIMEIEPYTFTDMPHIKSLSVDSGLDYVFREIDKHREWPRNKRYLGRWNDTDLAKVHRLHCDCSFAWYRNFLESKLELIEHKLEGAMAIIGSYMSKEVYPVGIFGAVGSVDCGQNFTRENFHAGDRFSYNTSCFSPC